MFRVKGVNMADLVYQKKRKDAIKQIVTKLRRRCNKAIDENWNEANTRDIILDFLTEGLGWNVDEEIDSESSAVKAQGISAGYCDYIISSDGKPYMVIEAKKMNTKLNKNHLAQAQYYALMKQIQWIVLTNGNNWQVYHLGFKREKRNELPAPVTKFVLETSISDINITPNKRADKLYLLSKEALKKDELQEYFDRHQIFSSDNLINKIIDPSVLDRIRISIKKDTGFNVQNKEIAKKLIDLFDENLVSENIYKAIRKL